MRILPINQIYTNKLNNNIQYKDSKNKQTSENTPKTKALFAYSDYNITFSGRTPEDFYAQDFNRENMPSTMKRFLDYDYEQRQHIPPEQMMQEVFKYLKVAHNFSDVKSLYPKEELFQNLHQNHQKNKTSVLAEIKMAKEMSDTPLLNDGSDDFGMYLLKKIYLEGKTIKEISKDFYEKDLNDEYKGIITKPINYDTTSAYGIKYPKTEFWQSFIATREEYKKFFLELPKNMVDPNREPIKTTQNSHSINSTPKVQHKPTQRKFKLQRYKKEQLTNDIKNSKGTPEVITNKIRKRFAKDDPEASFIIKYMSPIMTVAADRVHLSEELKLFNEIEKEKGKSSNDEYMFERFWKANPKILDAYAKAIPDTIELFEETYGSGGLLPINKDLEIITKDTENQKIIDNISPEFYDLLQYTQEIEPKRQEKYNKHNEMQKQWEEYFNEKYGNQEIETDTSQKPEDLTPAEIPTTPENIDEDLEEELKGVKALHPKFSTDLLKETAEQYNAEVFSLKGTNGENIIITGNLDEIFRDYIDKDIKIYPTQFGNQYKRYMLSNPNIDRKFKLSLASLNFAHLIDDDRVMTPDEVENEIIKLNYQYSMEHYTETLCAQSAMADTIALTLKNQTPLNVYELDIDDYNNLPKNKDSEKFLNILKTHKKELDELYKQYTTPLSKSETNKIGLALLDELSKFNGQNSSLNPDDVETLLMLKEMTNQVKFEKKYLRETLDLILPEFRYARSILNKNLPPEVKRKKFEQIMGSILESLLSPEFSNTPYLTTILNKELLEKHRPNLSNSRYNKYLNMAQNMDPLQKATFNYTIQQLKELDKVYNNKK